MRLSGLGVVRPSRDKRAYAQGEEPIISDGMSGALRGPQATQGLQTWGRLGAVQHSTRCRCSMHFLTFCWTTFWISLSEADNYFRSRPRFSLWSFILANFTASPTSPFAFNFLSSAGSKFSSVSFSRTQVRSPPRHSSQTLFVCRV